MIHTTNYDLIKQRIGEGCPSKDRLVKAPKPANYSLGYIKYFKSEWATVTGKLKCYPAVMSIPLVPEDRSHEQKVKRIKI